MSSWWPMSTRGPATEGVLGRLVRPAFGWRQSHAANIKVEATYRNDVLEVRVPKTDEAKGLSDWDRG